MNAERTFEVTLTPALLDDAAHCFVREYLAKRYGPLLTAATAINILGLSLAIWLGADHTLVGLGGTVFALPTLYFIWSYFSLPRRISARMQRALATTISYAISADAIALTAAGKSVQINWMRVKVVLEFDHFFLLVLSPFSFIVVPKSGLPTDTEALLHSRVTAVAPMLFAGA